MDKNLAENKDEILLKLNENEHKVCLQCRCLVKLKYDVYGATEWEVD